MQVQDLICPNCGGKPILDYDRGEYVCASCGLVLDRVYYTYSPSEVEARRVLEERLRSMGYTEIERREAGIREELKRFVVGAESTRILRAFMAKKSYEQKKKKRRKEKVDDIEFILEYESGMRVDLSPRIVLKYIHLIGFEVDPTASAGENWKKYVKSTPRSVRLKYTEFREYLQFVEEYMYLKMGEKYRPSKSRYGRRGRGKLSLSIRSTPLSLLRSRLKPLSVEHGILMDFLDHCKKCLGRRVGIEELRRMSRGDLIKLLSGFPYPMHILKWLGSGQNSW